MKRHHLLPLVSILAGLAGFGLRRLHLRTAFEPNTGLPIPGTAAAGGLLALSILTALLLLLLARGKKRLPMPYENAFGGGGVICFLLAALGALLTGAGAGLTLTGWHMAQGGPLELSFLVFGLLAALCMLLTAIRHYRLGFAGQGSMLLLPPAFFCCLWLMNSYQSWARDPFVSHYVFALLAIISAMLAYYYMAAYAFGQPREWATLLFCGLAVTFCLLCLADGVSLGSSCLYLGTACYTLPHLYLLGKNRAIPFENPNTPPSGPSAPLHFTAPEAALPKEEAPDA